MTRGKTKELLPAITHFANGGNLWYYSLIHEEWELQTELRHTEKFAYCNVIEDEFFEVRKAFALGEEVESRNEIVSCQGQIPKQYGAWHKDENPMWLKNAEYRIKSKEPLYEWQYYSYSRKKREWYLTKYFTEDEIDIFDCMVKFEPSKRVRGE
jgi:hypothetical protein